MGWADSRVEFFEDMPDGRSGAVGSGIRGKTLSRRKALEIFGLAVAGIGLAACGVETPTTVVGPTAAPKPKEAAVPEPTLNAKPSPEPTAQVAPTKEVQPTLVPKTTGQAMDSLGPDQFPIERRNLGVGGGGENRELNEQQLEDETAQKANLFRYLTQWVDEGYFPNIKINGAVISGMRWVTWPAARFGKVTVAAYLEAPGSILDGAFVTTPSADPEKHRIGEYKADQASVPMILTSEAWKKIGLNQSDNGSVTFLGETYGWVGPDTGGKLKVKGLVDPNINEWREFNMPTQEEELKWNIIPADSIANQALSDQQLIESGIPEEVVKKYRKAKRLITWVSDGVKTGVVPPEQGILVDEPGYLQASNRNPAKPGGIISEVEGVGSILGQAIGVIDEVVKIPQRRGYYIVTRDPITNLRTVSRMFEGVEFPTMVAGLPIDIRENNEYVITWMGSKGKSDRQLIDEELIPGRVVMVSRFPDRVSNKYRDENGILPAVFVFVREQKEKLQKMAIEVRKA